MSRLNRCIPRKQRCRRAQFRNVDRISRKIVPIVLDLPSGIIAILGLRSEEITQESNGRPRIDAAIDER